MSEAVVSGAILDPCNIASAVGAQPREAGKASPAEVFAMLARRWRTVAIAVGTTMLASVAYIVLSPPDYTASTSILLAGPRPMSVESQAKAIIPQSVLGRVVDQQHLLDDAEFGAAASGLPRRFLALIGLAPAKVPVQDRRSVTADALERAVGVERRGRTYTLAVTSRDAVKAAYLADAIAQALLAERATARKSRSQPAANDPVAHVAELRTRFLDAEAKVRAYRETNGLQGAGGSRADERRLVSLEADLSSAKGRTVEARAAADRLQRIVRSGRVPESTGDATTSPALERLIAQYADVARQEVSDRTSLGERHPAYIQVQARLREARRLIFDELRRLSGSADDRLRSARSDEAELARQVEDVTRVSTTTSQAWTHLATLQEDVEAARVNYDRSLQDSAGVAAVELSGDRIIAVADVPIDSSSPDRLTLLALSLVCGLMLGFAAAALREHRAFSRLLRRATAVRSARISRRDIKALSVVGSIPEMQSLPRRAPRMARLGRARNDTAPTPAFRALHGLSDDPASAFSAAVRRLYDGLRRGGRTGRAKVVLVTSDDAGAGKSTIAVNLIRAACERGERALLIEGNPSNPRLCELVEADAVPTLIELAGTTRLSFAVDAGFGGTFQLVPICDGEDDAVCRLRKQGVRMLVGIKGHFDFVVIDGPTIGADETASLVAGAVDQVVLVMPQTARPAMVEAAVGRLQVPAWKFHGTVLSKVDDLRIAA